MSEPSETPPPKPSPEDDEVLTVEVISPRKGKGKGKVKTTISTTYSLRSSDRQRLIEPSPSESVSSDLASTEGGDTELEETEIESDPPSKRSALSSGPSSGPSVAFPFDDIDESPSIKKRLKMDDDQISNVSDLPIDIELDYDVNEPVAGPSGLQAPVLVLPSPSPYLTVPGDMRAGAITAASTISSAASRVTSAFSSGPERSSKRQTTTPAPPQLNNWKEIVYTVSKYMANLLPIIQLSVTLTSTFETAIFGFPSQAGSVYFFVSLFAFLAIILGWVVKEISFYTAAFFCYIGLLFAFGSEHRVIFSFWGLILVLLVIFLGVYVYFEQKFKPRDLLREYQLYRHAINSQEIGTTTGENTDTEAACRLTVFPGVDLRLGNRQQDERPDSRDTLRPGSRGFSPIDSSRAASRARSRADHNIETVAIIEVSREDDSDDIMVEQPTSDTSAQEETAL